MCRHVHLKTYLYLWVFVAASKEFWGGDIATAGRGGHLFKCISCVQKYLFLPGYICIDVSVNTSVIVFWGRQPPGRGA